MMSSELFGPASDFLLKLVSEAFSPGGSTASAKSIFCVLEGRISVFVPVLGTCWTDRSSWLALPWSHCTNRSHTVGSFSSFSLISEESFIIQHFNRSLGSEVAIGVPHFRRCALIAKR